MAKQRAKVPKFGDWQNENYTVCFEVARKNKGTGIMINPNDPQQNPDMFPYMDPSLLPPPSKSKNKPEEPIRRGAVRPIPEHRATSRNDADFRQLSSSTARSENTGQRTTNESGYDGRGQKPTGRPVRPSAGSGQSFDRTPVHHQAKVTPGRGDERPRQRPVRRDETPGRSAAAVPKFGDWDGNENFTGIFNDVREGRNAGRGNASASATPKHRSYAVTTRPAEEPKRCCFPWW